MCLEIRKKWKIERKSFTYSACAVKLPACYSSLVSGPSLSFPPAPRGPAQDVTATRFPLSCFADRRDPQVSRVSPLCS
jgi:hypothetical protein